MSKIKEFYMDEIERDNELLTMIRDRVDNEIRETKGGYMVKGYDDNTLQDNGDFYDQQMDKMFWGTVPKTSTLVESKTDAVNPKHYQDIVPGMQYMEMMVYMLKNKTGVQSHLFGQVYKYLMRCGNKDEELQELKKAKWYLDALIKHIETGKVI